MAAFLQEYLVGLGFKIDDASYNKWANAIARGTKGVAELGAVVSGAAFAIEKTVEQAAENFERLYYVAQRNSAAISSIRQLEFGMTQIGLAAATGTNAVEHLGASLRNNPGFSQFLQQSLGLTEKQLKDPARAVTTIVEKLKKGMASGQLNYPVAASLAQTFLGVDEASFKTMLDNNDKAIAQMAEHDRRVKAAGLNEGKFGEDSVKLMTDLRTLGDEFATISTKIISGFIGPVDTAVVAATNFIEAFAHMNNDMGNAPGVMLGLASALGGVAAAVKLLGGFAKLLGFGAVVAEAATATAATATIGTAAAAATPAVAGLAASLAAVAWPLIALGALVGVSYAAGSYIKNHTAEIRKGLGMTEKRAIPQVGGRGRSPSSNPTKPPIKNQSSSTAKPPIKKQSSVTEAPAGAEKSTEDYIRKSAVQHGIDPNVALEVARKEGLNKYVGDRGSSFGPYQLHYGKVASGKMGVGGLGDEFTAETGLDARNPSTVKQQIDFAMGRAQKGGWTPWHGWTGARFAGINRGGGDTTNNTTVQVAGITVQGASNPEATATLVKSKIENIALDYSAATRNTMPVTR